MRRWVRKISCSGWPTLKTLSLRGLIRFKIFFLKVEYEEELRISKSNLFHSTSAGGKTIKEKAIPYLKLGNYQVLTIS